VGQENPLSKKEFIDTKTGSGRFIFMIKLVYVNERKLITQNIEISQVVKY
jgi:hypothetical protein